MGVRFGEFDKQPSSAVAVDTHHSQEEARKRIVLPKRIVSQAQDDGIL